MAERKKLFNLDLERFREIWDGNDWFNLQNEFKTKNIPLSESLLKWQDENIPYLTDFENAKTYDIHERVGEDAENPIVEVWERGSEEEQPVTSTDSEYLLSRLQSAQGPNRGFIDLMRRLKLDEIDLNELERAELAGAGFSFQPVQEELFTVYSRLREIFAARREWLLDLSSREISTLNRYLQRFYENVQQIQSFSPSIENPTETHTSLRQQIISRCDEAKKPLSDIVAFLSSRKVDQLETDVKATVAKAVDQLNAETSTSKQNNEEFEKQESKRGQEFEKIKLDVQNQLAEKPVSQYKAIFSDQADKHKKVARNWLIMTGVATIAFFGFFYWLHTHLNPSGTQFTAALQNLFAKGLLLSPIYLWLNRSIKNYTAQKHLEVINTHRQNALETFDTFVAAAGDNRETRDAVLLAATEAIFDANQTGYLPSKATGPDSRSPVQQVIREIIPQKSATKGG